jgi:hypothetical protein
MRLAKPNQIVVALALLLIVGSGLWTHGQWQRQLDSGRAQMLAELLSTKITPRVIENPGVEAWRMSLLRVAAEQLPAGERDTLLELLPPTERQHQLPASMVAVGERLHSAAPPLGSRGPITVQHVPEPPAPAGADPVEALRVVEHVRIDGATLVLTHRRGLFAEQAELPEDLRHVAVHLTTLAEGWTEDPPPMPIESGELLLGPPRLTRLYAFVEDGSLMSIAFPHEGERSDPAARTRALEDETAAVRQRPGDLTLTSSSHFTRFDYGDPLGEQTDFTGIYADVGGSGFVATVAVPIEYGDESLKVILSADLTIDIDLERLAAAADPSLQVALTGELPEIATPEWQPWTTLHDALPPGVPEQLRKDVWLRKKAEQSSGTWDPKGPVVHGHGEQGVLFAQQVNRRRWLVGRIEATPPNLPWASLLLVPGLLLGLLLWSGRRELAVTHERDAAREQLGQRLGVLDLLELPLIVVDPNDDMIISGNAIALERLHITPGRSVHEQLIANDERSQSHYHEHQLVVGGRRRSYGVYLRDPDDPERRGRYVLVRSISLGAAQPGLGAAANHRIGLVCEIDDVADLALLLEERVAATRQDERNKLAAIFEHGADTLARVLETSVSDATTDEQREFCRWLAEYLLGRLHVTQWVLEHWGGPARHDVVCILGPEHLHAGLAQYQRIFALVAATPKLRAQLHWDNGSLSMALPDRESPVRAWIDWPESYRLTAPADGVFGYVIGEILINAVKHGAPGLPIELEADIDRARRELSVRVRNEVHPGGDHGNSREDKAYGGLAIITEITRLCGWKLSTARGGDRFELSLSCPVTLQRRDGEAD